MIDASLDDVLSFLTPALIERVSRDLASPVSESSVRRHFREGPEQPMSVSVLRGALLDELSWVLLDPSPTRATAFTTVSEVLTSDLERGEQLRDSALGRGAESLLVLLLAVADSDPVARSAMVEVDRWFRQELEVEYRAAGEQSRYSLWCRELADVRYGEVLFWRLTRTTERPTPRHRDVLRWLVGAHVPEGVRRRTKGPRHERRLAGTEAPPMRRDAAHTRTAILEACFVVLANASAADLLGFLTPSSLAALAEPAVNRTTVAELYRASATSGAFMVERLLYDLWSADFADGMPDEFMAGVELVPGTLFDSPGASDSPEIDLWVRLCSFEAAFGDEHMRFRLDRRRMPERVRGWLAQAGRQPLDPRDETLRFISDALGIISAGKSARAKFTGESVDVEAQQHAVSAVLAAQSEPVVVANPVEPIVEPERGAKILGTEVARYYERVTNCMTDFVAWLDEIHADVNELLTPGTPPVHFLMAFGRPYDREVLMVFESLCWAYRWEQLERGLTARDWLLLPSRWIRVERVKPDGYRWWDHMQMVDEALLIDAHARAGDNSPEFLVELERTPRGRTLIESWEAWTSACICDGAASETASACVFDELWRQATAFLDAARSRSLELHRERTRSLDVLADVDFLFVMPHVMRAVMGSGQS